MLHSTEISPEMVDSLIRRFEELDAVLLQIQQTLVASRSHSPFNRYLTQLSTDQIKVLEDGVNEVQTALLCLVRHQGVKLEAPLIDTPHAIRELVQVAAGKIAQLRDLLGARQSVAADFDSPGKLCQQMGDALNRIDHVLQ